MDGTRRALIQMFGAPLLAAAETGSVGASPIAAPRDGAVSVVDHGALCDRTTDDTQAVQAAILACRAEGPWRDLVVPGPCRITSPLIVDRPVDTMAAEFRIIGGGAGGGFYLDRPMTVFDSRLPVKGDPLSEHIGFYDLRFEAARADFSSTVLSGKFLRFAFNNCWFEKIAAYGSPIYVQSARFRNCRGRGWQGVFAKSVGCFDVLFEANAFEGAGALFQSTSGSGVRFVGNLFEGSSGPFIDIGRAHGMYVAGNYTESNAAPDYIFTDAAVASTSLGVALTGNFIAVSKENIANPDFWSVVVGDCRGLASSGNFCNGRLFDDNATKAGELRSFGDGGYVQLNRSGRPLA